MKSRPIDLVDDNNLPSKRDLMMSLGMDEDETEDDESSTNTIDLEEASALAKLDPLRSSQLWSKKSMDMYKRIFAFKWGELPMYSSMLMFGRGDELAVVDSFVPSKIRDAVEGYTSEWLHFKSKFELKTVIIIDTAFRVAC